MKNLFIISLEFDLQQKIVIRKLVKVIQTSHTYSGRFTADLCRLLVEEGFNPNICKIEKIRTVDLHDIFSAGIDYRYQVHNISVETKNFQYLVAVNEQDLLNTFDASIEEDFVKGSDFISNKYHESTISDGALKLLKLM